MLKEELIRLAATRAANSKENYKFRDNKIIIESNEMKYNLNLKNELYNKITNKWEDRNSLIAAPFGSEMYLQSTSNSNLLLGCTRYYFDELNNNKPVDSTTKFPYSQDVQFAAKILTQIYRKRLMLKQFSALELQRVYRGYKERKKIKKYIDKYSHALVVLYIFFKKSLRKLHKLKIKNYNINSKALIIQKLGRQFIKKKNYY